MWKCLVISGVFTLVSLPSSFRYGQPLRPRLASTRTGPCCILCLLAGWSQSLCCLAPALLSRIQHPYRYTHTHTKGREKRQMRIKVCDSGFRCVCHVLWIGLQLEEDGKNSTFRKVTLITQMGWSRCVCVCVCFSVYAYVTLRCRTLNYWCPAWTKREDAQGQADSRSSCCLHALLISSAEGSVLSVKAISTAPD